MSTSLKSPQFFGVLMGLFVGVGCRMYEDNHKTTNFDKAKPPVDESKFDESKANFNMI